MKYFVLLALLISCIGMAQEVVPPVQIKDPILDKTISAFAPMQRSMTIMERIRKEILQKTVESVKGAQDGFTTDEHKQAVKEACAKNPLCAKNLEGNLFGTSAFDKVEEIFFDPMKEYNATVTNGVIEEDTTGFYDLKYTPAMEKLDEAESLVRTYFFVPYCPDDPVMIEGGAPLGTLDYKDVQDKFFLRRQQYMMDLALICFDLANEVYQATKADLGQNASAPVGGVSLQDDLYVTLKAQEALAKKIITESVLQVRLAEMSAAKTLLTLPLQIAPRPLYRQQEMTRLMQMEDPTFDMEQALKKLWCPGTGGGS